MNANRKMAAGVAAVMLAMMPLSVARADTQIAAPAPVHFVNDDGQMMFVDPPAANWKPQMVAIPLTSSQQGAVNTNAKNGSGK